MKMLLTWLWINMDKETGSNDQITQDQHKSFQVVCSAILWWNKHMAKGQISNITQVCGRQISVKRKQGSLALPAFIVNSDHKWQIQ